MLKLSVEFILIGFLVLGINTQRATGIEPVLGSHVEEKVETKTLSRAKAFPLGQVRLLAGPFWEAMERDHKYLLGLDVDRLVHSFRVNAGLPTKAEPLGGWEAPNCELRGHFTGHYMSACALTYACTGDERLRTKGMQVVSALAECQQALGSDGYLSAFPEEFIDRVETGRRVWAPWYTLHKIAAGLLDMNTLCGDKQALDVVTKMAAWTKKRTDRLSDKQMQEMLKVEFGGMAEVLCNLYAVTGKPEHLVLAQRFDHKAFLEPLVDHRDELKGLHANTHIPKAIAAAREYELAGDRSYFEAASFFWNQIVQARSYATGGTSNYEYWREEPYHLADQLSAETHENCCTYNMLKLTQHVFSWTADPRVADYYERALLNGILPTQHPDVAGAIMYYVPMKSGLFKMFGVPDSSYYCCNGTGIESFAKFGSAIYYHDDEGVFVNLFIASELNWEERGIRLRQETNFPEQENTTIFLKPQEPTAFSLHVRIPYWVTRGVTVKINGKPLDVISNPSSYLTLKRTWRDGDRVEVLLPMNLHLSRMPDDPTVAAVMYGPLVLAGTMGTEAMTPEMQSGLGWHDVERMVSYGAAIDVPSLVATNSDPNLWIKPIEVKPLTFRTVNVGKPKDVILVPFYKMFGQRYAVYWNIYSDAEWKALQESRPPLPTGVVDLVTVGDERSHRDHNFQAYRFETGESHGRKWIRSSQWFRYDMNVDPGQPMLLDCTYWGEDKDCSFDILIDGKQMMSQSLSGDKGTEFVDVQYPIPQELIEGKRRVAVMFRSKDKKPTCELYGCATVKTGN